MTSQFEVVLSSPREIERRDDRVRQEAPLRPVMDAATSDSRAAAKETMRLVSEECRSGLYIVRSMIHGDAAPPAGSTQRSSPKMDDGGGADQLSLHSETQVSPVQHRHNNGLGYLSTCGQRNHSRQWVVGSSDPHQVCTRWPAYWATAKLTSCKLPEPSVKFDCIKTKTVHQDVY